jgi:ribonuclease D
VQYDSITDPAQLREFCDSHADAELIAFDTEFVSEHSFHPQLCLVQVAVGERLAVIDPLAIEDLAPFWKWLADPHRTVAAHSAREELRFCLRAIGTPPHGLFDTQIAAGLIGLEYPAAYSSLVSRLLNVKLPKGETRTDWRRRPLNRKQIEYALHDVVHLTPLYEKLRQKLTKLGRAEWMSTEMQAWIDQIEAEENRERWRRVKGVSGLSIRSLAVLRELWRWRNEQALRRDCPAKRVLRDDLLVELARRQSTDLAHIQSLRGMERGDLKRQLPAIAAAIERGLSLPDEQLPHTGRKSTLPPFNLLGQFLATALGSICRDAHVSPGLVGTVQDVRDLIAWRLQQKGKLPGEPEMPPPALAQGWREEVVGHVIEELLDGKLTISIVDPLSEKPLAFEPRQDPSK